MNKGIAVAGNILVDYVKIIEKYPEKGMLVTILENETAVGGCVPNTSIDLKKIDPLLSVKCYGKVGKDAAADFVLKRLKENGAIVDGITISDAYGTSFSDVMTVKNTGERTFFHCRGANADFSENDIDVNLLDCDIFHIGYLMLLDSLDKLDQNGLTGMARLLKRIKDKGIKTSIDVVSETSGNFNKVVTAALPYCDYVIINEIEAGRIVGVDTRKEDILSDENVIFAMKKIMQGGVKGKVIVHCPEKGFCLDESGKITVVPSKKLPKGFIKGSVGAGDAFCAGCLYSLYNGYSDEYMLKFANLAAISCLSEKDSTGGVVNKEKLNELDILLN